MSATITRREKKDGERSMPVQELPMPPVTVQRPDTSGGVAVHRPANNAAVPVPHLSAVQLHL